AGLSGIDVAVARAKIAVDAPVSFRFPPARFMQRVGFLEDLQLRHASSLPIGPLYASEGKEFCVYSDQWLDVNAPSLIAAPRCRPINKLFHLVAVFPHQVEELTRVQAGSFRSEKG